MRYSGRGACTASFSLLGFLLLAPILPAGAQTTPSAQSLIDALRPTGNVSAATRGIRPIAPATSGAAAPAGGQQVAAAAAPSVDLTVQFRNGSADLTPQAMQALDALGKALASPTLSGYRFRIAGHTDTVGSAAFNKALSQQRAETVVRYLASTYGVDRRRLQAVGMGEEDLAVQTPPQTPEPRNRRVQVVNIGS